MPGIALDWVADRASDWAADLIADLIADLVLNLTVNRAAGLGLGAAHARSGAGIGPMRGVKAVLRQGDLPALDRRARARSSGGPDRREAVAAAPGRSLSKADASG